VAAEGVIISSEPYDSADAINLRAAQEAELIERYGFDSEPGEKPTAADTPVFLVMRSAGGEAIGCGGLRPLDATTVEIKRMFVHAEQRGRGLGRAILAALETEATRLGATRVVLETGIEQPEAMRLYERAGYRAIPCFGAYAGAPLSRCFERALRPL
jgi:putative acetyltransferase